MKLSTRLLLPLLATVAIIMLLYGSWALRQREATLAADAARETRAYATALGLAVEPGVARSELSDIQEIIDRISEEPTVFGVLVYDSRGRPLFRSDPVSAGAPAPEAVLRSVLATGEPTSFQRDLGETRVYSVVRPLRGQEGEVVGALEVAQPLTFLEAEKARTRQRFLWNTLTLLLAVTAITFLLVRRFVSQPLEEFAVAVRGLGGGDLAVRLDTGAAGGELAEVAHELNRMAERLEKAREDLLREGEEKLALERRLRHSERLAAMGELAAGVAHEIAAPLHVIRGRADLLLRAETEDRRASRNLQIIVQQIDRITLIVRNLLNFARRREPRAATVDLTEVLEGVVEFLEGELARTGVTLQWRPPGPVMAAGDPDLLHQVFLNLLINALQALEGTEEGARRIGVSVATLPGEPGQRPSAVVAIQDSGPGIPPELMERVFDPFFSTKTGSQSTGLGLAVARAIVEDHGGAISARAPQEGGALFEIVLPLAGSPVSRAEAVHA